MLGFVGIAVILVMVFGGYVLAGGKMGIILKSLPFELHIDVPHVGQRCCQIEHSTSARRCEVSGQPWP